MKAPRVWRDTRERWRQFLSVHGHFSDLVRKERGLLSLAGVALAFEVGCQLLAPWPIKYLFDGLLMPRPDTTLPFVAPGFPQEHPTIFLLLCCLAILVFAGIGGLAAYWRLLWAATAGQRMIFKLRKRLYDHLHRLSLRFHGDRKMGDLLVRITGDIPLLRDVLSESFIDLIGRFAMIIFTIGLLLLLDPWLALLALVLLVVTGALSLVFSRRIMRVARKQREKEGMLATTASEALAVVPLVKAYGREDDVVRRFARRNRSSLREGLKATRYQAALARYTELVFAFGLATVLFFGVRRALPGGDLLPGDLLVFVSYLRNLSKPLRRIARTAGRLGKAAACAERVVEVLGTEPERHDEQDASEAPPLLGAIEFQDVGYRYDESGPVALDGIRLRIDAGERLGIVGRNGAGKSTLVSLILRFIDPTQGELRFDGTDGRAYTRESLRAQISIVLQDTFLFGSTVRDNLEFAASDRDDEELLASLALVGADFVDKLLDGLDSTLTEEGRNLSGGERRKLALAGTLLRDTPILILDEPTTHIDRAARDDLLARLPTLTQGRTTLVITHDPALLDGLDRVAYLEQGRLVACGRHEQLVAQEAGYRALVAAPSEAPSEAASEAPSEAREEGAV